MLPDGCTRFWRIPLDCYYTLRLRPAFSPTYHPTLCLILPLSGGIYISLTYTLLRKHSCWDINNHMGRTRHTPGTPTGAHTPTFLPSPTAPHHTHFPPPHHLPTADSNTVCSTAVHILAKHYPAPSCRAPLPRLPTCHLQSCLLIAHLGGALLVAWVTSASPPPLLRACTHAALHWRAHHRLPPRLGLLYRTRRHLYRLLPLHLARAAPHHLPLLHSPAGRAIPFSGAAYIPRLPLHFPLLWVQQAHRRTRTARLLPTPTTGTGEGLPRYGAARPLPAHSCGCGGFRTAGPHRTGRIPRRRMPLLL